MSVLRPDFSSVEFRQALGQFATGVTVVTALNEVAQPVGITISSFNSVSLSPPLVLWSLSDQGSLLDIFKRTQRYTIHVLASDQTELALRFSRGTQVERFSDFSWQANEFGVPHIEGCVAWFDCFNRSAYPEGDHVIFVGEVEHCYHRYASPLIYHAGGFNLTPTDS